jgi:hypothetical protein
VTDASARTAANLIVAAAATAAAYAVLTDRRRRRLALRVAEWWLGGTVPFYLLREVAYAWRESANRM